MASPEYWLGEGFYDNDLLDRSSIKEGKAKKGGVGKKPKAKRPKAPKGQNKKRKDELNYWDTIGGPFNRGL